MANSLSLRIRLFMLILVPLMLMAILLGYWRFTVAKQTAAELFDRSLLSAGLAISRDVAVSEGDALSPSTENLIRGASGGTVFYHVTGPGGIYVTGWGYPPHSDSQHRDESFPQYFESIHQTEAVRVVRLKERQVIDGISGDAIVTVWQRLSDRSAFASELANRAVALILVLVGTVALVVWFGVGRGLRPLLELEDAIAARSPDDLSTIKRAVPDETRGIVETLNRLFGQLETAISAQQAFISDAAHQLRNPAAAVQSMAEAARDAETAEDRRRRMDELVAAARSSARMTEQLLSLDRLRQGDRLTASEKFDLNALTAEVCTDAAIPVLAGGLAFEFVPTDCPLGVTADKLFVAEAIKNLIHNAQKHGGTGLTRVSVIAGLRGRWACVTVRDDGVGLLPDQEEVAFRRFSQVQPSDGSGLGLSIAASVAERHGGQLRIDPTTSGASLTLSLPLRAPANS